MNKWSRRLFVGGLLGIVAAACLIPVSLTVYAAGLESGGVTPTFGLKGQSGKVTVVNPERIYVEYRSRPSGRFDGVPRLLQLPLDYGDACWMRGNDAYIFVGRDGNRVLVRSLQTQVGSLPDDAPILCNDKVYFWVSAAEFAQAAREYAEAERTKRATETPEQLDKRVVRRLIDAELARK